MGTIIEVKKGEAIQLNCYDSGVDQCTIYYSLDEGTTWLGYTEPIEIEKSGTIMYYAIDGLGNTAAQTTVEINMISSGLSLKTSLMILWLVGGCIVLIVLYVMYRKQPKEPENIKKKGKVKEEESQPKKRKIKRNN